MNANDVVAIVLALPGDESAWGMERLAVRVGGVAVVARVQRALADAGLRDICLIQERDGPAPDGSDWTVTAHGGSAEMPAPLATLVSGRPLLVVRADLPLLTAQTVRAFLEAADAGRHRELAEASGAMVVLREGRGADRLWADFLRPGTGRLLGDFAEGVWRAAEEDDVRRLAAAGEYSAICEVARRRKLGVLAAAGVLIVDSARTYVDDAATVGPRTTLLPGTHLTGTTSVGADCTIGPDTWIETSTIEDRVVVRYSVVEEARVRERSAIGPYAHLRPGSEIGPEARVGNFVEIKASRLGRGVKAGHLSYLGDVDVGDGTNVGAGAITCNYDGEAKHRTVVGRDAFVGSNVSLVAPVTVGDGAFLAAGSTITDDVPPETLAIARARQVIKKRKQAAPREET